jgi:polyphosphate kinase 2 (PPK2 family)
VDKKEYRRLVNRYQTEVRLLGYHVYQQKRPVVMVFEGWDAAGKGGAISRLTERMDPRGYLVHPIAAPRGDDADKHYLWRFWRRLPARGEIAIFDRSWYGRVMVERIEGFCTEAEWQRAFDEIREFEQQLVDFGTIVFKFWMHVSKDEQKRRFDERSAHPTKSWKLTDEDWRNREKWDLYEQAVEDMLIRTTTAQAPWTIVAGNDKYCARIQVLRTVVERLSAELHVDASPENAQNLPPLAAPTPIPEWAVAEAAALGVPVDGAAQPDKPKAKKKDKAKA